MPSNIINFLKENSSRLIMGLVSSFLLPFIMIYTFIIYMNYNNFFSYDFFLEGLFGMSLFFYTSVAIFLCIAIFSCSAIIIFVGKYKDKQDKKNGEDKVEGTLGFKKQVVRDNKILLYPVLVINFLVMALLFALALSIENIFGWTLFIIGISIILCTHCGILIFYGLKQQLLSFATVFLCILFIGLWFPKFISSFIGIGLRSFGAGGIKASVLFADTDKSIVGNLLLITPKYVYIQPEGKKGVSMIPIDKLRDLYKGSDINITKN